MDAGVSLSIPHELPAHVDAVRTSWIFQLVLIPLVGRIFLAWFPAGRPGGHTPRELPATWAASFLIGLTWHLWLQDVVPIAARLYVALGVPALALAARLATSPAALVPRHEPIPQYATLRARVGIAAAILAPALVVAYRAPRAFAGLAALAVLAAMVLADRALDLARAPSWTRALVPAITAIGIATSAAGDQSSAYALIGICGIAAGAVAWIRHGDRRALGLAGVGIVFLAKLGPNGLPAAVACGAALGAFSARPVRALALACMTFALVAGLVPRLGDGIVGRDGGARAVGSEWFDGALLALFLAAFAAYFLRRRRGAPPLNPSGAPVGREAFALAAAALGTWGLVALSWQTHSAAWLTDEIGVFPAPIASMWMLALLAAAIAVARALEPRATSP